MKLTLIRKTFKKFIQTYLPKETEFEISTGDLSYFTASFKHEGLKREEIYLISTIDKNGMLLINFVFGRIRDLNKVSKELNNYNLNAILAKAYLNESSNVIFSYNYLNCLNEAYLMDKLKEAYEDFFTKENLSLVEPIVKIAI